MTNPAQLNLDLCRALGIKDTKDVFAVTLYIRPSELPRIVVERHLLSADGLLTATEVLRLKPEEESSNVSSIGLP